MKIAVWGINYAPELTGIAPYNTALCRSLAARGHEVRMVTSFPYYPEWRKRPEHRGCLFRTERDGEVTLHRCWHYVPAQPSALKRMLHEASFVASSMVRLFLLPLADAYVVVSPPLLLGAAAWVVSRWKRAPFVFHVQDMQPDAAAGLGMLRQGWLLRALYGLEALAYRKAARVSGIADGMTEAFERKGVPRDKVWMFPNGVELPEDSPAPGQFRARHGVPPERVLVVYSGNLGVKQGLDVLLAAAGLLQHAPIRIVICGAGARRSVLEARVRTEGLRNVTFLPLQPEAEYRQMLVDTDIAVVTQQRGSGSCFFPSKLLANLAYGRPVLAVADSTSELARAMAVGGFGVCVEPEQPAILAAALKGLGENKAQRAAMGQAGRRYVEQFRMERVQGDFATRLESMHHGVRIELAASARPATAGE